MWRLLSGEAVRISRLLVVLLLAALPLPGAAADKPIELRLNMVDSFVPTFAAKRTMNAAYRGEIDGLRAEMQHRMKTGESLMCSAQIYQEVHWLVNYTDRRDDIERRLKDLKDSLNQTDQSFAARQDPKDGSFGPCFESWLWRFFSSVDPLKELAARGEKPAVPLKIWEPVDTPEEIEALMRGLLVSDLASGYDRRKELNLAITALGQLLWLDSTASVFPEGLDRAKLAEALRHFVDYEWQDAETGYWGGWYKDGNEIRKSQDLSITFHIISYRKGKVADLHQIALTTFAIRNVRYPFGWYSDGTQNNHHAYDIARIINLTWDELDDASRAQAGVFIFLMTTRSLGTSVNPDGQFDAKPYATVGEAYYFGISFFEEVGLFGNDVPRTRMIEITNTEGLRERISEQLAKLDPADPMVLAARRKLGALKQ